MRFPLADRGASASRSALLWDSCTYFGGKVVPGLVGLVSIPVYIRLIGLDQYGRFAVFVPVLMAIASASSGWLAQGVLRFHPVSTDPPTRQSAFNRAVSGCTAVSALVTVVATAAVLAGMGYSILTSLAALALCVSLLSYTVTLAKLQAQLQPVSILQREIVRSIGGLVFPLILVAITRHKQFELLLLGQAFGYTCAFWLGSRRNTSAIELESSAAREVPADSPPTRGISRQLWHFGWAVGLWLLLSQVLPVIDRTAIQRFAGYASAGVYASLYEIAVRSFSFLAFPLTQAAHPRIMRAWNEGRFAASYRIIRYSLLFQVSIFVAVFGGVVVLAPRIVRLILGFNDPTAARLLPVLLLGGFLWQLALLLHKPLEISHRTPAMLAAMAAALTFHVVCCVFFIPRYGYQAAGYIVVASSCSYIALILCLTGFRAFRGYTPVPDTPAEMACD
ncbi:MAG TPA: lipopolysaccharide biosynthesis protein [Candidatus Solibacter sp.]|nr:lipopolysaccharide biosynthesis protein [Candidatus Solibacter sp.]